MQTACMPCMTTGCITRVACCPCVLSCPPPTPPQPPDTPQEQERKQRIRGVEAVKANILAAKTVSRTLRSSLGPKGMDKMLQSPDGDVTISECAWGRRLLLRGCGLGRACGARGDWLVERQGP